jgi:cytochrome c oxidase cbb3-type subunit 2
MHGLVRFSLAATAVFYLVSFTPGRAFGDGPLKGQSLYAARCSACHQANGEGLPGAFPPLKGSGVVTKDDATKHIRVVLDGVQGGKAGGVVYATTMPAFAAVLNDADIADIIDYERSSWGNHGKPVTAAQVAAERAASK